MLIQFLSYFRYQLQPCLLLWVVLVAIGLTTPINAYSLTNKTWYTPDHVKLQLAGNIGFLSASVSKQSRRQQWETDLFYGYVPAKIANANIHTLAIKGSYFPFSWRLNSYYRLKFAYVGLGINYSLGPQFNTLYDKRYPKNYYQFVPLQISPLIGMRLERTGQRNTTQASHPGFYVEVATLHSYLINYYSNPDVLSLDDIINVAFGFSIPL